MQIVGLIICISRSIARYNNEKDVQIYVYLHGGDTQYVYLNLNRLYRLSRPSVSLVSSFSSERQGNTLQHVGSFPSKFISNRH